MLIAGLQKMSLVDYPGKVACTVFTGGCNLRCPFCHNWELLGHLPKLMETEDFFAFLEKRRGLLDGVCVSGGEPCLQQDLADFIRRVRGLGFAVKLDTNGFFPDRLAALLQDGVLDYVAMDFKNAPARYAATVGADGLACASVLNSLTLLLRSGVPFELRTTVVLPLHDAASFMGIRDALTPFVRAAGRKIPAYYLQSFTDRETVPFGGFSAPSAAQLEAFREALLPIADRVAIR